MSDADHIIVVRGLYAAFQRGDVGALLAMLSPDVEWGEPENPFNPSGGTRRGHAGFLQWVEIGRQSEEILLLEPREFLANRDSVAVVGHLKCRVKATAREYESEFVHLITFAQGKIVRFTEFFDTYAAAEAFRTD